MFRHVHNYLELVPITSTGSFALPLPGGYKQAAPPNEFVWVLVALVVSQTLNIDDHLEVLLEFWPDPLCRLDAS